MRLRVAPPPASSRPVRVASPGCPVLRSLSPEPAPESSGCPLVSVLRLCRRWIIESPRFSHLSAVPTCQFPSCPEPQPFGIADDSPPELPRASNPPAPIDGYPSYLGSPTIRFALVRSPSCPG